MDPGQQIREALDNLRNVGLANCVPWHVISGSIRRLSARLQPGVGIEDYLNDHRAQYIRSFELKCGSHPNP